MNKSVFLCQGVIEIIFMSGKYLLIIVMSSKHNTQLVFIGRNILMCLTGNECSFSTKSFWLDQIRICYSYAFFLSFIMCFFLPICTVKLIKFELKLNLMLLCKVILWMGYTLCSRVTLFIVLSMYDHFAKLGMIKRVNLAFSLVVVHNVKKKVRTSVYIKVI